MKHLEFPVALLVAGSAILLCGCSTPPNSAGNDDAAIVTRTVRDMETVESKNGKNERLMRAPLLEEHAFARPAYTEYTAGVEMVGFDSLGVRHASNIVADYAIYWTAERLWELKGNVVALGEDERRLYTQQLFYNDRTRKVWSNVDCKFEMGEEVFVGVGFDALVDFSYAAIRDITGYFNVEMGGEEAGGEGGIAEGDDASSTSGASIAATGAQGASGALDGSGNAASSGASAGGPVGNPATSGGGPKPAPDGAANLVSGAASKSASGGAAVLVDTHAPVRDVWSGTATLPAAPRRMGAAAVERPLAAGERDTPAAAAGEEDAPVAMTDGTPKTTPQNRRR